MCFELDSLPPVPAISGAAVSQVDLVLEAVDGNRFAAFLATPEEQSGTGAVIPPDVRGKQEELAAASEDAWARVLDFLERHDR